MAGDGWRVTGGEPKFTRAAQEEMRQKLTAHRLQGAQEAAGLRRLLGAGDGEGHRGR